MEAFYAEKEEAKAAQKADQQERRVKQAASKEKGEKPRKSTTDPPNLRR
jgi:hypothetical protein